MDKSAEAEKRGSSSESGEREENEPAQEVSHMTEIDLLKWENELLKREKALREREDCASCSSGAGKIRDNRLHDPVNFSVESNQVKIGIHEMKTLIREFNPSQNLISAKSWITSIEGLKNVYEWDDISTLFYATLRLGGAAYYWYQSKHDVLRTFEEFKTELVKSFPTGQDDASILMQIMERKRLPAEAIEDYVYQIAALAKTINLSETTTIRYIISGLSNQNLVNVLMASDCTNISDLLKTVKNFEEILKQGQTRHNLNHHNERSTPKAMLRHSNKFHPFGNRNKIYNQTEGNSKEYRPGTSNRDERKEVAHKGKLVCFRCNQPGHYAKNCTEKNQLRCYRCQQMGHTSRDCKTKQISNLSITQGGKKDEYHKIVYVEGKQVLAFFDLGSECSTIRHEVLRKHSWELHTCDAKLVGFGNKQTSVLGKIRKVVKVSNIDILIDIMVVDDTAQNIPMIIGRNFMDRPEIEVIKKWGVFEILRSKSSVSENNPNEFRKINVDSINLDQGANENHKIMLINLINDFRDCFAKDTSELGKTELVEMTIKLKDKKVIRYHPYKVAYGLKPILRKQIEELLKLDVIQPSSSEYASPVLLVSKKNGEHRMCVDYRKLNAVTQRETFPVPNIEETLNSLANQTIFTSLDLLSGYHQIPVEESSRHLTAFITPEGHYEFKRVPFGLTNAPAVFMKLMAKVIKPLGSNKIIAFMDDILISSRNIEENVRTIKEFLIELRKAGLTLNLKKCEFFKKNVKFLGHEVSAEGIKPGLDKTSAIENYKRPESAREVKQFLGLAGYFRRFIQGFSFIARPLHMLLRKDVEFKWAEETENSFLKLKELLSQRPILALYDENADHEVHTDASSHGIAGILMQRSGGNLRPVSYFSRATTAAESKYHSYELEALAVVETLERFKHYLLQRKFKVVTDCNSLRQTQEKKDLVPRIARWWLKISEYDFELIFRPASKLTHADALSRCPTQKGEEGEDVSNKMFVIGVPQEDWLAVLQREDSQIVDIRNVLTGEITQHANMDGIKGNFILEEGRVFKKTPTGFRFVVPKGIRWRVIKSAHDDRGHPGVERTAEILRKYVWFSHMKAVVKKYIASCVDCLYNKRGEDESRYVLHTPERQPIPFHTIHIDHLGPFPKSKSGNAYIIGLVDSFSKYVILKPTQTANSKGVIRLLNESSQYFGTANRIVSDRGTAFTSKDFEKYCHENLIKHVSTTVRTPRSNGQVERYFRTVKGAIATMTQDLDGRDWDKNIRAIQWALNSLKNSTTNVAPHQLVMTYKPRDILQNKLLLALHDIMEQEEEDNMPISDLKEKILQRISEKQQKQAEKFNSNHQGPRKYNEGDLVLIKQEPVATGQSRKVQPRYKGPYVVKAVLSRDRYVITDAEELQVTRKPYESVQSAERMKPWCSLEDLDFDDELEKEDSENEQE